MHENSGANHRADTQRRQLEYAQRAFQTMRACFLGFAQQKLKRLFRKEVSHQLRLSCQFNPLSKLRK